MRLNVFLNAYGKRKFVGILEETDNRIFFVLQRRLRPVFHFVRYFRRACD